MTTVLKITEQDFDVALDAAVAVLKSGGLIIYPTDTVYGIGADATSESAVKKVHALKESDSSKPLSVLVGNFGVVEQYCDTGIWEDMIIKNFLPGPYTFILKKRGVIAASQNEKIGIRFSENLFCQYLAQKFGRPIITTSANKTGDEPPVSFDKVNSKIVEGADLAIDGGQTKYKGPSLVIDLITHKMIREGGEEIDLLELPEI
jgi:L-threonylcarbamoyladenylate synthase